MANSHSTSHYQYSLQLDKEYDKIFTDQLHRVPYLINKRYNYPSVTTGSIFAALLHHKQTTQHRHYYLISQHLNTNASLNNINAFIQQIINQNKEMSLQISKLSEDLQALKTPPRTEAIAQQISPENELVSQQSVDLTDTDTIQKQGNPQQLEYIPIYQEGQPCPEIDFHADRPIDYSQIPLYLRTSSSPN